MIYIESEEMDCATSEDLGPTYQAFLSRSSRGTDEVGREDGVKNLTGVKTSPLILL